MTCGTPQRHEGSLVQRKPSRHRLIEHDLGMLVATVPQHHHADPRLSYAAHVRVAVKPRIPEVHLRNLPWSRVDGHRNLLRLHTTLRTNACDHALDRAQTALEVVVLEPQSVVDRLRLHARSVELLHDVPPTLDARCLLRSRARRQLLVDGCVEHLELRQQ